MSVQEINIIENKENEDNNSKNNNTEYFTTNNLTYTSGETFQMNVSAISEDQTAQDSDGEELDLHNLPDTVNVLKAPDGKTIYLVGTAHFSKQSHSDVRKVCFSFGFNNF